MIWLPLLLPSVSSTGDTQENSQKERGGGAKLYDGMKAWSFIKHSILSGSNPLADRGCESWLFKKAEFGKFISVLRIRIGFSADPDTYPDPAFFVMRIQIHGFDDQKLEKIYKMKEI